MKFELFVSRRLVSSKNYKDSVSAPIVKIAVFAVILSIVVILISIATGVGLQEKIRDKITTFSGHIHISNYDNNNSQVSLKPILFSAELRANLEKNNQVTNIANVAVKAGVIRTEKTFEGVLFKGVSNAYPMDKLKEYLIKGKLPQIKDKSYSNEVLISSYFARRLKVSVGDKIQTYFMRKNTNKRPWIRGFDVVGIYDLGIEQFNKNYIFGDLKHIQKMNKWGANEIGILEIFIKDFNQISAVTEQIYSDIPTLLNATSITEKYYAIFEWLKLFDTNIYIILILMIIVASINMIVALLVLILERKQMIGMLKALGTSNSEIQRIFLFQATYILLIGLVIGNLLSLSILYIQNKFGLITLDASQYYVSEVPVVFKWDYIIMINILFVVLCYVFMMLPSYIVAKMNTSDLVKSA